MIHRVPRELVSDIWPAIDGYVRETCEYHPFMEAADVERLLTQDLLSLFIAVEGPEVVGFGVLEVVQYPRRKVANIMGAGGRRGFLAVAIDELLPAMIEHGKTQGATVVTLSGRPGWLRALRHLSGRSQRYITWWADIDEQQGRRQQLNAPNNHPRAVEAGSALSH